MNTILSHTIEERKTVTLWDIVGETEPEVIRQNKPKRRTKQQILEDSKVKCPKCKYSWYHFTD